MSQYLNKWWQFSLTENGSESQGQFKMIDHASDIATLIYGPSWVYYHLVNDKSRNHTISPLTVPRFLEIFRALLLGSYLNGPFMWLTGLSVKFAMIFESGNTNHAIITIWSVRTVYEIYIVLFYVTRPSVVDIQAPLKQRYLRCNQVPYMNGQLRKAINQRNMCRNKHFKDKRNPIARAQYVHCRNNVVKITKSSVNTYFRKNVKIIMTVASSSLKLSSHFWITKPIVSVAIIYYWMKTEE